MEDAEEAAGTRPAQVCQACRLRHRKCDWDGEACKQCVSIGIECIRQPTFRFRYDPRQRELAKSSISPGTTTPSHAPLRFHDETPDLRAFYGDPPIADPLPIQQLPGTPADLVSQHGTNIQTSPSDTLGAYLSPLSNITSPQGATNQYSRQAEAHLPFSPSEAFLVRNFGDNMALWTDVCDPVRTFEVEVPRRALSEPILRHAICAFSARHYSRCQRREDWEAEALDHQNKCIELLIPAMSGRGRINDSTLTAIALLRQNEEMDEQDNRFHLEGMSRVFNMVPEFAVAGGLGEAACWLCLRMDIYVSITTHNPINIGLECFFDSASIRRADDQSWASKSILNLAFLLNRAFSKPSNQEAIAASEAEIAEWDAKKPVTYQPIQFNPRSHREGRCFPEIWTLSPFHAVGLQYFHIAQIILNVLKLEDAPNLFNHFVATRAIERQVRHHLLVVVGLAVSNEKAENTWFTARHCLSVWGHCLRQENDQAAVLAFLERWGERSGWKTSTLIESLRRQWDDDGKSD